MLSDTKNVTRHESKKLEKKVFLWQFFRKNEKKYQNHPLLPYLKIELFLTSCKKHRYPAGYPATSDRISGIRPPPNIRPDIRIRLFIQPDNPESGSGLKITIRYSPVMYIYLGRYMKKYGF